MRASVSATSPRPGMRETSRSPGLRRFRGSTRCAPTWRSAWCRGFSCRSRDRIARGSPSSERRSRTPIRSSPPMRCRHRRCGRPTPRPSRLHRLDPDRVIFAEQSEAAITAGAFHNDVVAVANERVLFAHELAFADKDTLVTALENGVPGFEYVEVPAAEVPLADAVRSYL